MHAASHAKHSPLLQGKKNVNIKIKKITINKNIKIIIKNINKNSFKINKELWKTIVWISKYYCTPIGKVLNTTIAYQHMNNFSYPQKKIISITIHLV